MIERWFVALVLAVATSACITGSYEREDRQSMPTPASVQALVPGTSLQACLDALGAPLVVRARGVEAELIWGWQRSKGWICCAASSGGKKHLLQNVRYVFRFAVLDMIDKDLGFLLHCLFTVKEIDQL